MYDKGNDDPANPDPEVRPEKEEKTRNNGLIRAIMIILFILTLCSLILGLWSTTLVNKLNPRHGFGFTRHTWVFWCWLPIPIASVILGFKYKKAGLKCMKNIIGGFIMGFFLLYYGCFCLIPTFERDYGKIDLYRSIIDADLPDNGQLEIREWGTYFDDDKTEYVVINAYYDREDTGNLERSIATSGNWIPCGKIRSELRALIPSTLRSDSDAYYSIYNKTTGEYNALPGKTGNYEIYAMRYDKSDKQLAIHQFLIDYLA